MFFFAIVTINHAATKHVGRTKFESLIHVGRTKFESLIHVGRTKFESLYPSYYAPL